MSSDDDEAMLQRHQNKAAPALSRTRPPVAPEIKQTIKARQGQETLPQKFLRRTLSNAKPGKLLKSSDVAAAEQDSDDDDAQLLQRHLKRQQQPKVCLPWLSATACVDILNMRIRCRQRLPPQLPVAA